ncbi:unnamed protein product [Prunus brigantina]
MIHKNLYNRGDLTDQEYPSQIEIMFLQEAGFDIGDEADPTSFREAMENQNADKWREAMLNELESMKNNQVWELVEPHKSQKPITENITLAKGDLKMEHCLRIKKKKMR